jgi:hypothetical protein
MTTQPSAATAHFLCVGNGDCPAALEVRKIYEGVPDPTAEQQGFLRVIDESGEDYLHPAELFVPIKLASPILKALAKAEPHNEIAFWRRRSGARGASAAQTGAKALVERARLAARRWYLEIAVRSGRRDAAPRGPAGLRRAASASWAGADASFRDGATGKFGAFSWQRQDPSLESSSCSPGGAVGRAVS